MNVNRSMCALLALMAIFVRGEHEMTFTQDFELPPIRETTAEQKRVLERDLRLSECYDMFNITIDGPELMHNEIYALENGQIVLTSYSRSGVRIAPSEPKTTRRNCRVIYSSVHERLYDKSPFGSEWQHAVESRNSTRLQEIVASHFKVLVTEAISKLLHDEVTVDYAISHEREDYLDSIRSENIPEDPRLHDGFAWLRRLLF